MSKPTGSEPASDTSDRLRAIVRRTRLHAPVYGGRGGRDWRQIIVDELSPTDVVLDVGKSSRDHYSAIKAVAARIDTLDINRFEDYPDHLLDLCSPPPEALIGLYDKAVCFSVLESLYDPQAGIDNLRAMLKDGGRLYLFAPFIGKYEGPRDQSYYDFFRFTRDGLAYLLRDFASVDIYPVRGQYAAIANLMPHWKLWIERRFGHGLNRALDRLADPDLSALNASGYNIIAVK
jgi:hypothetical protein